MLAVAGVDPLDIVVVSPPAALDDGLVFAGSDVLAPGTVTIYLHNITAAPISVGSADVDDPAAADRRLSSGTRHCPSVRAGLGSGA